MYYNPNTYDNNCQYYNTGMYQQGIPVSPVVYQQPTGYNYYGYQQPMYNYYGYYQQPQQVVYQQPVMQQQPVYYQQYMQQLQEQQADYYNTSSQNCATPQQLYNFAMNLAMLSPHTFEQAQQQTQDQTQQVQQSSILVPIQPQQQPSINIPQQFINHQEKSIDLAGYYRQGVNNDIAKLQAFDEETRAIEEERKAREIRMRNNAVPLDPSLTPEKIKMMEELDRQETERRAKIQERRAMGLPDEEDDEPAMLRPPQHAIERMKYEPSSNLVLPSQQPQIQIQPTVQQVPQQTQKLYDQRFLMDMQVMYDKAKFDNPAFVQSCPTLEAFINNYEQQKNDTMTQAEMETNAMLNSPLVNQILTQPPTSPLSAQIQQYYQQQVAQQPMINQQAYYQQFQQPTSFSNLYSSIPTAPGYNYQYPYPVQYQYPPGYLEHANTNVSILQKFYNASCTYNEVEPDQEVLDSIRSLYFPREVAKTELEDYKDLTPEQIEKKKRHDQLMINTRHLMNTTLIDTTGKNPESMQFMNNMYTVLASGAPSNVGMIEYFNNYSGRDYTNALQTQHLMKVQNIKQLYNHEDYIKTVQNKFGNTMYTKAIDDPNLRKSMEDYEVKLPYHISDATRQERRARFFNSILSQGELR